MCSWPIQPIGDLERTASFVEADGALNVDSETFVAPVTTNEHILVLIALPFQAHRPRIVVQAPEIVRINKSVDLLAVEHRSIVGFGRTIPVSLLE